MKPNNVKYSLSMTGKKSGTDVKSYLEKEDILLQGDAMFKYQKRLILSIKMFHAAHLLQRVHLILTH